MNTATGQTFWYELYPQILFARLYDFARDHEEMRRMILEGADQWLEALPNMKDENGNVSFEFTSYDFIKDEPVSNGRWIEPPNSGIAFLLYASYQLTGDSKYLEGAKFCMDWLQDYDKNPYYEVMSDYASYMAAAMNFKFGTQYDVEKMLNWLFDADSDARPDLGVITGHWGDYSANGIVGSTSDGGGYGFMMNTYHLGSTLAPTAKYDPRFSTAIGKWFLNASNSLRIMYPNELPAENQSHGGPFSADPNGVIGYEGVRKTYNGQSPYAMGDPTVYGWGKTDYGLYGSTHVGIFGALIDETDVEQILRIDLNALDSFKDEETYPQYLYYNPYAEEKAVTATFSEPFTLFDTVTNQVILENVSGNVQISIPAESSRNLVVLPAGTQVSHRGHEYYAGGTLIAKDRAAVSILSPDTQKSTASGTVNFELSIDAQEPVESVSIYADHQLIKTVAPAEVIPVDTTALPNGSTLFEVEILTESGLTDRSSIKLDIFNENSIETAYQADAEKISTFAPVSSMEASVSSNGEYATITENNPEGDWGAVQTEDFLIDFDRNPMILIDTANLDPVFTIQLKLPDQEWGLYVSSNNNNSGQVILNLNQLFANYNPSMKLEGQETVSLYLMANGKEGASFDVRELKVFYDSSETPEETGEDYAFTAEDIAEFTPGENGTSVQLNGKTAIVEEHPSADYGAVQSPVFEIDFDKNPSISIDVAEVSHKWTIQLKLEDEVNAFYIAPDNTETGSFTFNLAEKIAQYHPGTVISGIHNAQIYLMANGGEGCYLIPNSVSVTYPQTSTEGNTVVYEADWETIQTFDSSPAPAKIGLINAAAHIVEQNDANTASIVSEPLTLDLDREIQISAEISAVDGAYSLFAKFDGDDTLYTVAEDQTETGSFTCGLADSIRSNNQNFQKNGIQTVELIWSVTGEEGASLDIAEMAVEHSGNVYVEDTAFDAEAISKFTASPAPGSATLQDGIAVIQEEHPSGNYGGVSSTAFQVDFSRNPMLNIEIAAVDTLWTVKAKVSGVDYYVLADKSDTGSISANLADAITGYHPGTELKGVQNVELWIWAQGSEGATVSVNSISVTHDSAEIPLSSFSVTPGIPVLTVGESVQLEVSTVPSNAEASFAFCSSNPDVASVTANGLVTASSTGTAIITVTANGSMGKSVYVTVRDTNTPPSPDSEPEEPSESVVPELPDFSNPDKPVTEIQDGWVKVDGKWYYLSENGAMLADTVTPDGYHVDASGAWIG